MIFLKGVKMKTNKCSLCNLETKFYLSFRKKDYYICQNCGSIEMHPDFFISVEKEKKRYELHKSDILDIGYQRFVEPITNYVISNFSSRHEGLDFGAGNGQIIAKILKSKNIDIKVYDPLFHNDKSVLNSKYDYIIACEVIEHFHNPSNEFALLFSLLKTGGKLIIMTDPLKKETSFIDWYYKNDETHVFFYSNTTFQYIKNKYGFKSVDIKGRLIVFEK